MTAQTGWWAQPFRPDGGSAAEGLRNQLGRPSLSVLTVLVRESAQNSWDARLPGSDVRFALDLGVLDAPTRTAWRSALAAGAPTNPADEASLRSIAAYLAQDGVTYLAVSDRGASGLGGPSRSDVPAPPGERGWLSFVLNSGERRDVEGGGGTYGFGKGAFFLASRVGTVLIYTRYRKDGVIRSRLIGSALLQQDDLANPPLTGRHWWGRREPDHCAPLEDSSADSAARALGLPPFEEDETGTTVVVLDPDLSAPGTDEDRVMSLSEAARHLADAAALNLWPIMIEGREQRLVVRVSAGGEDVPVPDETSDEVIRAFAAAFRRVSDGGGVVVASERPKAQLGRVAHEPVIHTAARGVAAMELGLPNDRAPHHAALLRAADLVVKYHAGPQRPEPTFGYAAVFRAHDDMDHVFAAAEPPTHDEWVPDQLAGRDRTYVRVAQRRIEAYCHDVAGAARSGRSDSAGSVGRLSRRLGFLMDAVTAEGGAPDPFASETRPPAKPRGPRLGGGSGGPGGGGAGTARLRMVGTHQFIEHGGGTLIGQRIEVAEATRARAVVHVVTGEGTEHTAPVRAGQPHVVGWLLSDDSLIAGDTALLPAGEATLLIQPVEDAAIEYTVGTV